MCASPRGISSAGSIAPSTSVKGDRSTHDLAPERGTGSWLLDICLCCWSHNKLVAGSLRFLPGGRHVWTSSVGSSVLSRLGSLPRFLPAGRSAAPGGRGRRCVEHANGLAVAAVV